MLSIIIVNYNVKYFLGQCLCSVQRAIEGVEAEVIVVDNNSSDGSVAFLQPLFPTVRFIVNRENLGYARANNIGWKESKGDLVLFLNPDTILGEESLKNTTRVLYENPKTGAIGIRMIDGTGSFLPESKRGFPSPAASFYKLTGLANLFPKSKVFAKYYLGNLPADKSTIIDVIAGAFMIIRRSVLEITNGFDEAFFMYGEDVDLSYRIQQLGFHNYYLAESPIIHFKGESTQRDRRYVKMFYIAMSIFVKKHYRGQSWWYAGILQLAIFLRAVVSFLSTAFIKRSADKVPGKNISCCLIGNDEEAKVVKAILNQQPGINRVVQQFSFSEWTNRNKELKKPDEIIFCSGQVSFNWMIEEMVRLGNKVAYRFYSAKCGCIIASDSKKSSGDVMLG